MARKKPEPTVRKSTPTEIVEAKELNPKDFIRTRSGEILRITTTRKRQGVVRIQFDGTNGVFELPRTAPVVRFEVAA
jgi:hypothetical protein